MIEGLSSVCVFWVIFLKKIFHFSIVRFWFFVLFLISTHTYPNISIYLDRSQWDINNCYQVERLSINSQKSTTKNVDWDMYFPIFLKTIYNYNIKLSQNTKHIPFDNLWYKLSIYNVIDSIWYVKNTYFY